MTEHMKGVPAWLTPPRPHEAIEQIRRLSHRGHALIANRPLSSDAYDAWKLQARHILMAALGDRDRNVIQILGVGTGPSVAVARIGGRRQPPKNDEYYEDLRVTNLTKQLSLVASLIEVLEEQLSIVTSQVSVSERALSSNVFLVHGQDEAAREGVARFLERLRLTPIILHEQADRGRTIIEKFVDHSDVGFAVVLLTGDDQGGLFGTSIENQKPRARQNVILELGFFLGKLGRSRLCALYQEGVEIPSDFQGVIYIAYDSSGAWRLRLAKELKTAGLNVDMNDV